MCLTSNTSKRKRDEYLKGSIGTVGFGARISPLVSLTSFLSNNPLVMASRSTDFRSDFRTERRRDGDMPSSSTDFHTDIRVSSIDFRAFDTGATRRLADPKIVRMSSGRSHRMYSGMPLRRTGGADDLTVWTASSIPLGSETLFCGSGTGSSRTRFDTNG